MDGTGEKKVTASWLPEGFTLEAMATGLPCIAVRAGAVPELVKTSKNGYLCDPDDPEIIAKCIVNILSKEERRERMSKESLKMVKKHDIAYTLTRMEEIYNKVLDARKEEAED